MKTIFGPQRNPQASIEFTRIAAAVSASTLFAFGFGGCASAAPYNPSNLEPMQLSQVASVCQSVMGLSPSEQMSTVWGPSTNPDLTPGENYYQGCIAGLSHAAGGMNHVSLGIQADADCRSNGMAEGSPALAECILKSQRAGASSRGLVRVSVDDSPGPARSFYSASPMTIVRWEEEACARLGLNPLYGGFAGCIKELQDTFHSIDNPQN